MSGKQRRVWKPEDKLRIVLAGMEPAVEISELCRREGINPTQYYAWKKTLMSSASRVFQAERKKPSRSEARREAEMSRLKNVIAEITAENLELKKRSRIRRPRQASAGAATAGSCGGEADQGAKWLACAADAGRVGRRLEQLLPLAAGGGVGT